MDRVDWEESAVREARVELRMKGWVELGSRSTVTEPR